jgi:O-antigen ligase
VPPVAFIYGLSVGFPLTPDARVTIFDLFSLFFLLKYCRDLVTDVYLKRLLLLSLIYFAALMLSTEVNNAPLMNMFRRGGTGVMLLIEICGIYLYLKHSAQRNLGVLIVAIMLGAFLYMLYPLDARMADEPLKFLLATPIPVLAGGAFFIFKLPQIVSKTLATVAALLLAGMFFLQSVRNPGGILIVFSGLIWLNLRDSRLHRLTQRRILIFQYLIVGAVAVYALTEAYTYAAIAGYFGARAANIAEFQHQFLGSILLGGRPEILANIIAISESPLYGWGPLVEDFQHQMVLVAMGVYGEDWLEGDGSLYHSMVFEAGHEAGIPAMLLWLALLYWCLKACLLCLSRHGKNRYFLPLLIAAIWNLLFSPLISTIRPQLAVAVAFAFMCFNLPEFKRIPRAKKVRASTRPSFENPVAAS